MSAIIGYTLYFCGFFGRVGHRTERIDVVIVHTQNQIEFLEIIGPYYGGADGFENVLNILEDACEGIIEDFYIA